MKKSVSHARSSANVDDRLRAAGLKRTAARAAVLRYLEAAAGPASHADATAALAAAGFDRVTVFRVLVDLVEAGLARRLDLGGHVYRFEIAKPGEAARELGATFTCEACGRSHELPPAAVTLHAVRGAPKTIKRVRVYVRGICDACS